MIGNLLLSAVVMILSAIFAGFKTVTTLPTIFGFDIDASLVQGMGYANTFMTYFWPLRIMFNGFIFLMGYYSIKMILSFILGHRSPGGK